MCNEETIKKKDIGTLMMNKEKSTEIIKQNTEKEIYDLFDEGENFNEKISELPEIKVIHAVGLFQMPDGTTRDKFEGILLHEHQHNAWWEKALNDNEPPVPPDCFSIKLVKGESMKPHPSCNSPQCTPSEGELIHGDTHEEDPDYFKGACDGTCEECDLNKFGSKGKGKACNNKIALFLLVPDYFVPLRLEVSASSLSNCIEYTDAFKVKKKRYQTFGTTFALETKTKGANTFSVMNFVRGSEEKDIKKLKVISRIINDYMDLMLKVPEIQNALAE